MKNYDIIECNTNIICIIKSKLKSKFKMARNKLYIYLFSLNIILIVGNTKGYKYRRERKLLLSVQNEISI